MSEDIKNKGKTNFRRFNNVKQQIIEDSSYEVLIEAGDIIARLYIQKEVSFSYVVTVVLLQMLSILAAEFLIRLTSDVNRQSIPALALAQDTSTLTACINDYGPDDIFKRFFLLYLLMEIYY